MTKPFPKRADLRKALSFVRPGETPMLSDVIAAIRSEHQLSQVRRRDMASALLRIAAACDRAPSELFADPIWLRQQLATRSPLSLGRSPKTRANILSNAMAALAHSGIGKRRPAVVRSAEWERLWKQLSLSAKIALGSFTRFCSFHRISPTEVTDKVVGDFAAAMELASLRKKPAEALRELTVHWNRAVNLVPGWPTQTLTVPNRRCIIAPSLAALPLSF